MRSDFLNYRYNCSTYLTVQMIPFCTHYCLYNTVLDCIQSERYVLTSSIQVQTIMSKVSSFTAALACFRYGQEYVAAAIIS